MFSILNLNTKKKISLLIIFVIFMSCFSITTLESNDTFKYLDICEKLSNNDIVDFFYEAFIMQYNIVENKYRDRSFKIYSNNRIAVLFVSFDTNNIDKLINKSNLLLISENDSIQDIILLFIHNKDGKKSCFNRKYI